MRLALFILCFITPLYSGSAAWIYFSEANGGLSELRPYYLSPTRMGYLRSSDAEIKSDLLATVPGNAVEIEWMRIIPRDKADALKKGLILQGAEKDGRLEVGEVIPLDEKPPGPEKFRVGENMIPGMFFRAFGVEERLICKRTNEFLELSSEPGIKPAGILLTTSEFPFPKSQEILEITFSGHGHFEISMASAQEAGKGRSTILGKLDAEEKVATARFNISGKEKPVDIQQLVITVPVEKSDLRIQSIRMVSSAPASVKTGLATWLWSPEIWKNPSKKTMASLREAGFRVIYVSYQLGENGMVAESEKLKTFLRLANEDGLEVWAVDGDPYAILPGEQEKFVKRAKALQEFNATCIAPARFAGMQWDIEPYLIPGFNARSEAWISLYLETLAKLHSAQGMPMELCVPFWFSKIDAGGKPLLESLSSVSDGLTIMDYRTGAAQILESAEPFLAWGERMGKKVRIALELGPIPDEKREHYRPASEGTLWCIPFGSQNVMVSFKKKVELREGFGFAKSRESMTSGNQVTFQKQGAGLMELLPELQRYFSGWSSFEGMALHEALPALDQLKIGKTADQ